MRSPHKALYLLFAGGLLAFSLDWLAWSNDWVWLERPAALVTLACILTGAAVMVTYVGFRAIADGTFSSTRSRALRVFISAVASTLGWTGVRYVAGSSGHTTLAAWSEALSLLSMSVVFFAFLALPRTRR
jgi:hypothetical protein